MPHRKLVQIGKPAEPPPLPTIAQYFADLARRQAEDIRLLKQRAQELVDARAARRAKSKSIREESWRLHPVIPAPAEKRATTAKKTSPAKKITAKRPPLRSTAKKRAGTRATQSRSR